MGSQASGEDGGTRAARCEVTCVRDPAALRTLAQRRDRRAGLRCGKRKEKSRESLSGNLQRTG